MSLTKKIEQLFCKHKWEIQTEDLALSSGTGEHSVIVYQSECELCGKEWEKFGKSYSFTYNFAFYEDAFRSMKEVLDDGEEYLVYWNTTGCDISIIE